MLLNHQIKQYFQNNLFHGYQKREAFGRHFGALPRALVQPRLCEYMGHGSIPLGWAGGSTGNQIVRVVIHQNPIILTLVYRHGAVVLRDKLEYCQILATDPSASLIKTLMDAQHRRVVRHVAGGEIEVDGLVPEERIAPAPPKSLEELIEEYLCTRRRAKARSAAHREV